MKTAAQELADRLMRDHQEIKGCIVITIVDTHDERLCNISVKNVAAPYLVLLADELIKKSNLLGSEMS